MTTLSIPSLPQPLTNKLYFIARKNFEQTAQREVYDSRDPVACADQYTEEKLHDMTCKLAREKYVPYIEKWMKENPGVARELLKEFEEEGKDMDALVGMLGGL